jgi:acetolactate decarboxylase
VTSDKKRPTIDTSIYLCAPVNALVEGIYEENVSLAEIQTHGDFGLGTFNDLDGEMVMIDGRTYQITADGRVREILDDQTLSPFACVTFYNPISHDDILAEMSHERFEEWLDGLLPSPNLFYAIRIEGEFSHIKARSVPKQANYRPLVEVAQDQSVFEFTDVRGTMAGFYTPSYMASLNVPGMHLHFLSEDKQVGGHVLECSPREGRVGVQFIRRLELSLPMTFDYLTLDFQRDIGADLDKVEK